MPADGLKAQSPDILRALSTGQLFDAMASRMNGERAAAVDLVLGWDFTDTGEKCTLTVLNGAMSSVDGRISEQAQATVTTTRATLDSVLLQEIDAIEAFSSGAIAVAGDGTALGTFLSLLDEPPADFPIVTPRP